jgi:LuxR family transcriptional regulator, maltose regulon positive regulatory protein
MKGTVYAARLARAAPLLHRQRLTDLIDRAARHRVALVCAPAGAGKTVACAWWAAAPPGDRRVAWLTLKAGDDQAWFWADVCASLTRARAVPPEAVRSLQDASAEDFPLRLVEVARLFATPVVLMLDNAHTITDEAVLAGLDVLIRHAAPALSLLFAGRRPPGLQLGRLQASGELAMVGASSLACTPDEVDAYLALLGLDRDAVGHGACWIEAHRNSVPPWASAAATPLSATREPPQRGEACPAVAGEGGGTRASCTR